MCARFELLAPAKYLDPTRYHILSREMWEEDHPALFPGQMVAVIEPGKSLVGMRWGLIPRWVKSADEGKRISRGTFNARSETLEDKPSFQRPFRHGRCLMPATAYFEWRQEGDRKALYRFSRVDGELFYFAALSDTWRDPAGSEREIQSCTLVTTIPNPLAASYHDRMPVILTGEDAEGWLSPDETDIGFLKHLLAPYPEELMLVQAA